MDPTSFRILELPVVKALITPVPSLELGVDLWSCHMHPLALLWGWRVSGEWVSTIPLPSRMLASPVPWSGREWCHLVIGSTGDRAGLGVGDESSCCGHGESEGDTRGEVSRWLYVQVWSLEGESELGGRFLVLCPLNTCSVVVVFSLLVPPQPWLWPGSQDQNRPGHRVRPLEVGWGGQSVTNMAPNSWLEWGWWNCWPGFVLSRALGSSLLPPCGSPLGWKLGFCLVSLERSRYRR